MSDEYIKRWDAYSTLTDYYNHRTVIQHASLTEALNRVPPADVAPVRHGRWIGKAMRIMCSDCGAEFNDEIVYMLNNYEPMPYCPNCGAKMDEEDNGGR